MVTIVFSIIGVVFLLVMVNILTSWTWLIYIIVILIVIDIIYAIVEAIKTEKKKG